VSTAVHAAGAFPGRRVAWGRWLPRAVAAATLGVLVWRLGTGPFLDGLRTVDAPALLTAAALAVVTTVCCAVRWRIVARSLGAELPLGAAVAAYYRSLFLNVTLPGGVLGDVHRGVRHGLGAVVVERCAGQVVQAVLTVAVLLALPSPVQAAAPWLALALAVTAAGTALVLRHRLPGRRVWAPVALMSALVVAGHAATFLLAARTAGVTAPVSTMLPLALLVLAAAALPNVGGWGPREGVTAWAFGATGLGAAHGVATAVVYGVMVIVASLPGAAVLAATWGRAHA
jgi:glycosyltransferase 2 family protein